MEDSVAINLLQTKQKELNRLPKRSDFTSEEVCLIKAKLGPWNRALEKAGLKDISPLYASKRERIAIKRGNKKEIRKES